MPSEPCKRFHIFHSACPGHLQLASEYQLVWGEALWSVCGIAASAGKMCAPRRGGVEYCLSSPTSCDNEQHSLTLSGADARHETLLSTSLPTLILTQSYDRWQCFSSVSWITMTWPRCLYGSRGASMLGRPLVNCFQKVLAYGKIFLAKYELLWSYIERLQCLILFCPTAYAYYWCQEVWHEAHLWVE